MSPKRDGKRGDAGTRAKCGQHGRIKGVLGDVGKGVRIQVREEATLAECLQYGQSTHLTDTRVLERTAVAQNERNQFVNRDGRDDCAIFRVFIVSKRNESAAQNTTTYQITEEIERERVSETYSRLFACLNASARATFSAYGMSKRKALASASHHWSPMTVREAAVRT